MADYAAIQKSLYEGNAPRVKELVEAALAEGCLPQEILNEGLIAGMKVLGEDFKNCVVYVPEVLVAVHSGMKVFGVGCITDLCLPDALEPVDIREILRIAAEADPKLTTLLKRLIVESPETGEE